uniref:GATA-type domain-containing protein n=1 Tax=Ananas comosus var. bracteatus TaxID=296719 RepID=A0A6V7QQ57_ANACO|nr:unnamed protein product [Ananas comosus var. bracteatus]
MEYYNFLGLSSSSSSSASASSSSASSCSSILSSSCLYSSSVSVSMNGVKVEKDLIGVLEERGKYSGWITPLWRTGPDGPKSLCNACGIRYRKEEMRLNTNLTLGPSNPNARRPRLFYD